MFFRSDCSILEKKYPNIKDFIIGDGTNTDFKDMSFDIVYSNATLKETLVIIKLLLLKKEI